MQPIVIGYHLIWTIYGVWLPNDPRGSGSSTMASDVLRGLGEVHHGRKRIQPVGDEIRAFYDRATPLLKHPVIRLDPRKPRKPRMQAETADAFAAVIDEQRYTCYACAIMPDHVHLLIRKHKHQAEDMLQHLRDASRLRLSPSFPEDHPVWVGGLGWKVFLYHPNEVRRTIRYIEDNPPTPQHHSFVKPYDDWPLHPGHSPRSPYAKALKAVGRYP